MIVDGYSLDLYCDLNNPNHGFDEFPHEFHTESGAVCRQKARRKGWKLDLKKNKAICPTRVREGRGWSDVRD